MNEEIKKVLEKIMTAGFKAYVVGGYVRDFLLDKPTTDVDICTDALPVDLSEIFADDNIKVNSYGSINLKTSKYNFDITTFRKDLTYVDGKLSEIEYIKDLKTDIKRRDFTINALYMDHNGTIIDEIGGMKDLTNKEIKVIGNIDQKFSEDPLRILRAIRLMITHKFKIAEDILEYIYVHKKDIEKISKTRKKEELTKMLLSENVIWGFSFLKEHQLLDILGINYDSLTYVDDINGMFAQLEFHEDLPFTKEEKDNIDNIKTILAYKKIDYGILFKYGLYLAIVAGKIMHLDSQTVSQLYATMNIKNKDDLAVSGEDIMQALDIKPSKVIKEIEECLIMEIINNNLVNDKEKLITYLKDNKGKWHL